MNLVKAQELAKDLSIQELRNYANGSNPQMMPPYIALGALQAKELTAKKMQEMQGAAQGQQPSVKEQVEQKAGLMALQQQQQQQAQQQMAQQAQRQPMPAPEGIPQPQAQPQQQAAQAPMGMPTAMAQGGITRLPVQFNFEQGGIIGYAGPEGSQVTDPIAEAQARAQQAQAKLRTYGLRQRQQDPEGYAAAEQANQQAQNEVASIERSISGGPAGAMQKPMGQAVPPTTPVSVAKPEAPPLSQADMAMRQAPVGGLPAALPKTATPPVAAAPRPVAPVTPAAPVAPTAGQATTAPNQDQLIEEEAARRKAFGIDTEAGAGAESRMAARRKQFEAAKPSGLDDLIRVFGQAGQYKGLSGMGPAYTANEDRKRAQQAAFEAQMEEQKTGIEEKRRTENIGRATGIGTGLEKSREQERQAKEARERNLTSVEVAKINAASANRPGETERMMAEYSRLKVKDPVAAAQYLATLSQIKTGLPGGKGTMTRNEAQDNVSNLMKDVGTSMQMKKEAAESLGQKNPKISDVIEYHVQKMMGKSGSSTDPVTRLKFDATGNPIK
jgi:hypothetical protein